MIKLLLFIFNCDDCVNCTTPIPMHLRLCVKPKLKTEYSDYQILFNLYSFEYTAKTQYLEFKLINFFLINKYSLILNLMLATCSKTGQEQQKTGKRLGKFFGTFHRWTGFIQQLHWIWSCNSQLTLKTCLKEWKVLQHTSPLIQKPSSSLTSWLGTVGIALHCGAQVWSCRPKPDKPNIRHP